ncbi:hypothetical protein [Natrarchaeobaculum sulfurireducens]|uniref:TrkA, K+ transport system, NAD-binding component n=1 Tax=Natrarchaeobaculum sulfurireducens TaxID=2044521 RepID=A0A346PG90_9EURY|nr:hypothetical protein [Natrarchaeobaculum sulfurireducens]AXR78535.1 TrkA, K+ transport system, NAD-binding component [Natrarchaeobaculum sulfurireducens]AXR81413.1 TrkA, K+ transport system, NAD-binding component [Natrarchaeobaculum sulfurireducens]
MGELPYESLVGIAYGLLFGFVPALIVGLTAVGAVIVYDRSLSPIVGAATVAPLTIASGAIVGIFDPAAIPAHGQRTAVAGTVAGVLGVVTTSQGTRIATELPRDRRFPLVRGQSLSAEAIDAVDAMGQVTIRPIGPIREFDGYPPLSPALRTALEEDCWRFPADLQLAELERRLERRLRTEHGLARATVSIDGRGRTTIAAAPPEKRVATTLAEGTRAVTVEGLLPSGIEPGDAVVIDTDTAVVHGTVLTVGDQPGSTAATTATEPPVSAEHRTATAGFDGGHGRLTVTVETTDAGALLEASQPRIAVSPRGDAHEFEAAALLEEAGRPVTEVVVGDRTIDPDRTLAVRHDGEWLFAVDEPEEADKAFVAGSEPEVSG